jgi:hypothetical integral membrane protein (TIGR02206 family)
MNPFPTLPKPLADFLSVDVIWWERGDSGFKLFGPEHLIALAICAVVMVLLVGAYCSMPAGCEKGSPRRRTMLAVSTVALCSLASTNVLFAVEGVYSPAKLPLYSCNLCEFLIFADAIHPCIWLDEITFAMGIFGGVCAILCCGWTGCPIWSVTSVTGFLEHTCIVSFPLMRVAGGDFVPRTKDVWMPMALTALNIALLIPYNIAFGTNFMFVPAPQGVELLENVYETIGNPAYTMLVLVTMCLGYLLLHWLAYEADKRLNLARNSLPSGSADAADVACEARA